MRGFKGKESEYLGAKLASHLCLLFKRSRKKVKKVLSSLKFLAISKDGKAVHFILSETHTHHADKTRQDKSRQRLSERNGKQALLLFYEITEKEEKK